MAESPESWDRGVRGLDCCRRVPSHESLNLKWNYHDKIIPDGILCNQTTQTMEMLKPKRIQGTHQWMEQERLKQSVQKRNHYVMRRVGSGLFQRMFD